MKWSKLSTTGLTLGCLLLVLCKLWLVGPHELVALKMPHDDLLFVTLGQYILQGQWLGPYNQLTLIKGPFYPLFIAGSYLLDIPLLAAQQLLYAFASFVCVWALFPIVRQRWILLGIFLLLLMNPFSYNYPAVGRVFRLGIYQSLGLLVFSSVLGMYIRARVSWQRAIGWAVMAGLALSAFWHTREESIWIVPSLLLLFGAAVYENWRLGRAGQLVGIGVYLLPVLIWAGATFTLETLNKIHYGVPATIELETPAFKAAYGGLLRIKSKKWRQYIPVVKDVREQAYKVSPAFKEIKPYLEGEVGQRWIALSHTNDLPAGFFIWTFRDAVAYAGYYKNGPETLAYYRRIGQEIDAACDAGKLECRPRFTSLVPPWHREFNASFFPTFFSVFKRIISFQDFSASTTGIMSKGSRSLMQLYDIVTREKLRTSKKSVLHGYPAYHRRLNRIKIRILTGIGGWYETMVPVLFTVAIVLLLVFGAVPALRKKYAAYIAFALACLGGLFSITFILTLLVITSYDSINRAMHVSYPLVLLTIICMLLAAWQYVHSRCSVAL